MTCALLVGFPLWAQVPDTQVEQKATRARLQQIRAEIKKENAARDAVQSEQAEVNKALREIEETLAATSRKLAEMDADLAARLDALAALKQQRQRIESRLLGQREEMAALLRAAYRVGRDQTLQLLLERDRVDQTARLLAYNRYLQKSRLEKMRGMLAQLQQFAGLSIEVESAQQALLELRAQSATELQQFEQQRETRAQQIAQLDARLGDHRKRLALYARDEKALLTLLEKLQDVLSDIPQKIAGSAPLAQQKGALPWPLAGKVLTGFGAALASGRLAEGVVIAAASGAEVKSVAYGRVAYADWLRGFGMLIIVDHGDGFMSLYGQNEALMRDEGDWVEAGAVLARAGDSGGVSTPGLYFELRRNSQPLNPLQWLRKP